MPNYDHLWVFAFLTAITGAGLFLRVVAKEKHRRERHLQARLEAKLRQLEEEDKNTVKEAEKLAQGIGDVATAVDAIPVLLEARPA